LPDKRKDSQKGGERQFTDKQLSTQECADKLANSSDPRQLAIKTLLEIAPVSVDDKLATVKTAHYVDKDRFQNAFRRLMSSAKSRSS
jgi:hypothetical protein